MKTRVITCNEIEGLHYWYNAPLQQGYLKYPHRHIFEIRCQFEVAHSDRDIEIIKKQNEIYEYIENRFRRPADFAKMSCEMIAEMIIRQFGCVSCEVLEDGKGGAIVFKEE